MDLPRLLWARVSAAHAAIGAPVEPLAQFGTDTGDWTFFPIGTDGVAGIHHCPNLDGDAFIIALPTAPSRAGTLRAIEIMREHLATGRCLYTMAWKGHVLAVNINQRIGGQLLGIDSEGFYHFKHTYEGLTRGQKVDA